MKRYVNDDLFWEEFTFMLNEKKERHLKQLQELALASDGNPKDVVSQFRLQGRIYALNDLLKLKQQLEAQERDATRQD